SSVPAARTKQSSPIIRQLRRSHHVINKDRVFGTHTWARAEGWDGVKQKTALLPAPFWCTYAWNRPTSTGAGGSDPLWLCWLGEPWLAIRWRGYAAFKRSQLER